MSAYLFYTLVFWSVWLAVGYLSGNHRRRITTEEKAKVVTAFWGTELIQFLAALDIFHQDDFEEKDERMAEWML